MQTISKMLNELGLNCSDIVRVDVHLSNLDYFDEMDESYRPFFEGDAFPARTTTESPRLLAAPVLRSQYRRACGTDLKMESLYQWVRGFPSSIAIPS
jgi:enamine deaminase RidA (YjgF/YER057c/UK114 family)